MLRKNAVILATLACFSTSVANAIVTNVVCTSGGYIPAIYTWDNLDRMSMRGYQYSDRGWVYGTIYTDTAEDPTITLANTLDNDTGFVWTSYHVNVSMNQIFSISDPSISNPGWTAAITSQPIWNGSVYLGQVDFTGGVPVGIGQLIDFSYKITFTGALQYTFTQELVPVPEPSSFSLLLGAGLVLGGRLVAGKRRATAPERV